MWFRRDGVQLVRSADNLRSGALMAPLSVTETLSTDTSATVWTGALFPNADGVPGTTCTNFTASNLDGGRYGSVLDISDAFSAGFKPCASQSKVYCVER